MTVSGLSGKLRGARAAIVGVAKRTAGARADQGRCCAATTSGSSVGINTSRTISP
jgi:hypothetical protein